MSFRNLVIGIIFLAVFRMALGFSVDTDTWWHLRTGELIAETRSIPQVDTFSYTRGGQDWRYPSTAWLSELQLYFVENTFGLGALNLWVAAWVTLAFAFIYLAMRGQPLLRGFILVLAAAASGIYWAARPYMLTFLFSAVFLFLLEEYRWKRRDGLLWLPLVMVLWVNSHGGFAIGFLLLAAYLLGEAATWLSARLQNQQTEMVAARSRLLRLGLITVVVALAACLNPAGPAIYEYPFETVSIGTLRNYIAEWQSPDFHTLIAQPFAWLLLVTLGIIGASAQGLALTDFLLLAGFGYMSLVAARNIPMFALAAPLVLSRHAQPWLDGLRERYKLRRSQPEQPKAWQRWLNLAIFAVLALVVLVQVAIVLPPQATLDHVAEDLPIGAIEAIRQEQPEGQLFNSYNWGGYLIWALPEYPVYVDGRTDLYGDEVLQEWLDVVLAKDGWQEILADRNVHLILLEKEQPVVPLLPYEGWKLLYEDDLSVVYTR